MNRYDPCLKFIGSGTNPGCRQPMWNQDFNHLNMSENYLFVALHICNQLLHEYSHLHLHCVTLLMCPLFLGLKYTQPCSIVMPPAPTHTHVFPH